MGGGLRGGGRSERMGLAVVGLWLELRGSIMSGRVLVVYFERGWPMWVEKLTAHSRVAWFDEALG